MLIERYVSAEILKPFAAGLAILVTVFFAFSAAIKLADAASGQIPPGVVAELIALNTLIALEVLLPTTLYLAVLAALGRLHRDSEMAALAAAGVGEWRALRAVLWIAALVALAVALLSAYGRPWAYARTYTLEQQALSRFDFSGMRPGSFVDLGNGGYVLQAREVDVSGAELGDVFVQLDSSPRAQIITARRARVHDLDAEGSRAVEFFDGHAYLLDRDGTRDVTMRFASFLLHFPEEERITRFRRKAVPTTELAASDQPKDIAEFQWRLTTPFATLLLAALAVPLARSHPRQSRYGMFVVAVLAYVLLFTLTGAVRNALENGDLPAQPGLMIAYVPFAVLLGLLLAAPRLRPGAWRR